jgi:hypothetical protein
MSQIKSGQIIPDKKKPIHCCLHKNLVPLEIGFARKSWPNGYTAEPYYNFAINLIGADTARIRAYLCLDCGCEVKAPEPGSCRKDRL